jgi:hypothetical protein
VLLRKRKEKKNVSVLIKRGRVSLSLSSVPHSFVTLREERAVLSARRRLSSHKQPQQQREKREKKERSKKEYYRGESHR